MAWSTKECSKCTRGRREKKDTYTVEIEDNGTIKVEPGKAKIEDGEIKEIGGQ